MLKTITINTETHRVVPLLNHQEWIINLIKKNGEPSVEISTKEMSELIDEMLAAAPEFTESPWLPIESAPKDGTHILIMDNWHECITVKWIGYWALIESGYYAEDDRIYGVAKYWLPLPSVPEGI